MRLSTLFRYHWLIAFVLALTLYGIEARGGGGRRGGSVGSLFGGLRKHKKHPSGGVSARRTINGSPMHVSQSFTPVKQTRVSQLLASQKPASNYPRQPQASGHQPLFASAPQNTPPLPPGGVYYVNSAAIPPQAIYYPQPPMSGSSSSGTGDFFTGLLVGNVLSHRHRHDDTYVVHHHHHQQMATHDNSTAGAQTIIINNTGVDQNAATMPTTAPQNHTGQKQHRIRIKWPTMSIVPLAPFNTTLTPPELTQPSEPSIFKLRSSSPSPTPESTSESSVPSPSQTDQPPAGAAYGIICVPMQFNETDPTDATKVQVVEKIVCYPAPPPQPRSPPPPTTLDAATTHSTMAQSPGLPPPAEKGLKALPLYGLDAYEQQLMRLQTAFQQPRCVMRTFVERDPSDASKTIEVQREYCNTATTQNVQVAGEINDHVTDNEREKQQSSIKDTAEHILTTLQSMTTMTGTQIPAIAAANGEATTMAGATTTPAALLHSSTASTSVLRLQPFP